MMHIDCGEGACDQAGRVRAEPVASERGLTSDQATLSPALTGHMGSQLHLTLGSPWGPSQSARIKGKD